MIYKLLGKRIKLERQKNNLTQEQLAEKVDISSSYMGQIERGERNVTIDNLIRIANILNVSIDYLLQDSLIPKNYSTQKNIDDLILNRNQSEQDLALNMLTLLFSHIDKKIMTSLLRLIIIFYCPYKFNIII